MIAILFMASTLAGNGKGDLDGRWQLTVNLGELPYRGSFKLGAGVGYHFNDFVYVGGVVQIPDRIRRGESSFNSQRAGLEGLTSSEETVGWRSMLHARIRPHRLAPFLSIGMVHNARDTETTQWDDRERTLAGAVQTGPATITWSRPAGVRPAVGLGWAGDFGRWHVGTEWTGALFGRGPTPDVEIDAPGWSAAGARQVDDAITDEFSRLVFNRYHLFVLEFGRRF